MPLRFRPWAHPRWPEPGPRTAEVTAPALLARNLVRLTMLPGGQEVGQRLAVGLGRQLSRAASAYSKASRWARNAVSPPAGPVRLDGRLPKRPPRSSPRGAPGQASWHHDVAARLETVVASAAGPAGRPLRSPNLPPARRRRLCLLHAGPVVTAHRNHAAWAPTWLALRVSTGQRPPRHGQRASGFGCRIGRLRTFIFNSIRWLFCDGIRLFSIFSLPTETGLGRHSRRLSLAAQAAASSPVIAARIFWHLRSHWQPPAPGRFQHARSRSPSAWLAFFTLLGLTLKGVVDRFAKRVPQLLFGLCAPAARFGLGLPAVLSDFTAIDAQHRRGTQPPASSIIAWQRSRRWLSGNLQRRAAAAWMAAFHGGCSSANAFAEVPGIAPAVGELVQRARKGLPLVRLGRASLRWVQVFTSSIQRQAAPCARGGLRSQLVQPASTTLWVYLQASSEALP